MTQPLFDPRQIEIKLGGYGVTTALALSDPNLHPRVQEFRRMLSARMIPLEADEILKRFPTQDYLVSRKVDGEFSVLVYRGGSALLLNPGGTVRVGLPALKEAADLLSKAGVQDALIAAELYVVRTDGKRPRVHDVSTTARDPQSPADLERLRLAVFDLIELNKQPIAQPYATTWSKIQEIFGRGDKIHAIETVKATSAGEIQERFKAWVQGESAEGLVVRGEAVGTFKVKPRHSIDVVVLGFTEAIEDRVGMMHDLMIGVRRNDGTFHIAGRVGGGFSEELRRSMLSDLKDMVVESEYAEVSSDHVAYQMVRPEWVIEISCLDMISQTTRGGPINRMVLNWNATASKYEIIRQLPLCAIISPQFIRRREDKTNHPGDVNIRQVANLVEVALVDRDARQLQLPKSQVLRREAYTKVLKGQMMVRKLILWKTNKETEADGFPAYVLHFTDYSPDRKQPLQRDLRISNSLEQMHGLWQGLFEENIKKGWNKIESVSFGDDASTSAAAVASLTMASAEAIGVGAPLITTPLPAAAPSAEAAPAPSEASPAVAESNAADAPSPAKKRGGKKGAAVAEESSSPTTEPATESAAPKSKAASKKKTAAKSDGDDDAPPSADAASAVPYSEVDAPAGGGKKKTAAKKKAAEPKAAATEAEPAATSSSKAKGKKKA